MAFVVCFFFAQHIFNFLAQPLANILLRISPTQHFIYTDLTEVFFTQVKVAFFGAACLTFPIFASQIWIFVAPGLYKHERAAFLPFLVATPILFLIGSAVLYYLMLPVAWRFFLGFQQAGGPETMAIDLEARVGDYVSLVMKLIFAFGHVLPASRSADPAGAGGHRDGRRPAQEAPLCHRRRSSRWPPIITPPDPFSMMSLAMPIVVLYEISIWSAKMVEKQAGRARAAGRGRRTEGLASLAGAPQRNRPQVDFGESVSL